MRRAARVVAAVVACALLAACGAQQALDGSGPQASAAPTPTNGTVLDLPLAADVSALRFTDQDGHSVSLDSLKGRTVVLTDFLTLCQEICPLTTANYLQLAEKLKTSGSASKVTLLEITVDPARDTVARLKAYQQRLGAYGDWQFWTGTSADLARLWKALGVFYEKTAQDGSGAVDWLTGKPLTYDVSHQDVVFVLGADGHEKWLVQGTAYVANGTLPDFLRKTLNSSGKANLASPQDQAWSVSDVEAALRYVAGIKLG